MKNPIRSIWLILTDCPRRGKCLLSAGERGGCWRLSASLRSRLYPASTTHRPYQHRKRTSARFISLKRAASVRSHSAAMFYSHLVAVGLLLLHSVYAACPPGTVYGGSFNKCYEYITTPTSFLQAEEHCLSAGGHLVTVQSAFENSYVGQWTQGVGDTWIGLNYLQQTWWSWTTGANATYSNWALNQPYDPSIYQGAVILSANSMWSKAACNERHPFLCEYPANYTSATACPTASPTLPPTPQTGCGNAVCASGYSLFPNNCRCYKFDNVKRNYQDSKAHCLNENATMVSIESSDVNAFLFALMSTNGHPKNSPWISLLCPDSVMTNCYWYDGTHLTNSSYTNFQDGYPIQNVEFVMLHITGYWEGKALSFADATVFCQKNSVRMSEFIAQAEEERKKWLLFENE